MRMSYLNEQLIDVCHSKRDVYMYDVHAKWSYLKLEKVHIYHAKGNHKSAIVKGTTYLPFLNRLLYAMLKGNLFAILNETTFMPC